MGSLESIQMLRSFALDSYQRSAISKQLSASTKSRLLTLPFGKVERNEGWQQ